MGKSLSESAAEILNATIGKKQEPAQKMSAQVSDLGGATPTDDYSGPDMANGHGQKDADISIGKKAAAAVKVAPKPGQASTPGDKAGAPKNAGTSKMFNQPAASAGFGDSVEHDGETVIAEEEDLTEEEIEEYLNSLTEEELEALVSETSEEDSEESAEEVVEEEVEQMSEEEIAEARKAAMKKMVSDKMSSCKEDVDALFNGESLSEEFRTKATTIFEAAVRARVETVTEEIFAENEKILADTVASLQEEMSTQVDEYLKRVVEGWLEDNQLAVETGLRAEIAEDFMAGLKNLFAEHYIEVPQEKADLVEEMAAKVVEAEEALAEQAEQFAALTEALNESKSKEILRKICEGLTEVQVEKIKALAEGVKFTTEGEYTDKLAVIRENYFPSKSVKREAPQTVVETEEARDLSGVMDYYVKAISKTLPK